MSQPAPHRPRPTLPRLDQVTAHLSSPPLPQHSMTASVASRTIPSFSLSITSTPSSSNQRRASSSASLRTRPTGPFSQSAVSDTFAESSVSRGAPSRRPLRRSLAREPVESTMEPVTSATKRTFGESDTELDYATSGEDMAIDDGDERVKRLRRSNRTTHSERPTSTLRQRRRDPPLSLSGRLPSPRGFVVGSDGMLSPGSPARPMLPRNATAVTPPELTPPIPFSTEDSLFGAAVVGSDDEEEEEENVEIEWVEQVIDRQEAVSGTAAPQQETTGERMVRMAEERQQRMATLRQELRSPTNIPLPPRPHMLDILTSTNQYETPPPLPSSSFAPHAAPFAPQAPRFPNSEAEWSRYLPGTVLSPSIEAPTLPRMTFAERRRAVEHDRAVGAAGARAEPSRRRLHPANLPSVMAIDENEPRVWGEVTDGGDMPLPPRPGALNGSRMRGPTVSRNEDWLQRGLTAEERRRSRETEWEQWEQWEYIENSRIRGVLRDLRTRLPSIQQDSTDQVAPLTARERAARLAHYRGEAAASRARAEEERRAREAQQGGNIQRPVDFDPFAGLHAHLTEEQSLARQQQRLRRLDAITQSVARNEPFDFAAHDRAIAELYQSPHDSPPRLPYAPFAARRAAEPTTPGDPYFNRGLTQTFQRPPRRTGPWEWLQAPGFSRMYGFGDDATGGFRSMLADPRNYMPDFEWDYDALTALGDSLGEVKRRTATADEVANDTGLKTATAAEMIKSGESRCPICLCDYEENESLRRLKCDHAFHQGCVENWLTEGQNNCPTCRRPAVATAL